MLGAKFAGPREGADPNSAGNHRKNLTLSLEAGLRRMRTDYFDVGVLLSQVAIAWIRSRHSLVHPILRARSVDQVAEHIAALDVVLSGEMLAKLESATGFELGYPHDYVAEAEAQAFGSDRAG